MFCEKGRAKRHQRIKGLDVAIDNEISGNSHGRCRGLEIVRLGPVFYAGTSIGALCEVKISGNESPSRGKNKALPGDPREPVVSKRIITGK